MASVVVDGLVIPVSLAGHPALDFCNTRAGWGAPRPKEYLVSHAHLAVWARENGLVPGPAVGRLHRLATDDADGAAAVLARAVAFRDALYAVLTRPAAGARPWAAVDAEARRAVAAAVLRPTGAGGPVDGPIAVWDLPDGVGLALPLLAVARSAADLLTGPAAGTVAACPGAACGWLFADPRGRRRWCSMAMCGNRAKARRHAERHGAGRG